MKHLIVLGILLSLGLGLSARPLMAVEAGFVPVPLAKPSAILLKKIIPEAKPLAPQAKRIPQPKSVEAIRKRHARNLFSTGNVKESVAFSQGLVENGGGDPAVASWLAGLGAWRNKDYADAATYFEKAASLSKKRSWLSSASLYWTARAMMRSGRMQDAPDYLERARAYPNTFYGLLAGFTLGRSLHVAPTDRPLMHYTAWQPRDGYQVSPALLHAIIKHESRFNPSARSPSGAEGLMQIMPSTARHVTGRRVNDLMDPATNIAIGQRYIAELMGQKGIKGDLVSALIAYNAGPGNLRKWKAKSDYKDDPLYFIESIPSAETRAYVERVLYSYWAYQLEDGFQPLSLTQIAQGRWAQYDDLRAIEIAARRRP